MNNRKITFGHDSNMLTLLLVINLTVFALMAVVHIVYFFTFGKEGTMLFNKEVFNYVSLPAQPNSLLMQPWSVLSFMFIHSTLNIWSLVGNMLWLWAFGYILQDLTGTKKIIPLYLYGSFAGALVFILAYQFIPGMHSNQSHVYLNGASASVMAIAIATTTIAPQYRLFPMINGGIPIWIITCLYFLISLATIPFSQPGVHLAQLAGGAIGFFYMKAAMKGQDWGAWINNFFSWANNLFNPDKPKKGKLVKGEFFYKTTVTPFQKNRYITQQKVDDLLDKINRKGYPSLTEEEKEILKKAGKEI